MSEDAILFLARQGPEPTRWARPAAWSLIVHALGLLVLAFDLDMQARSPVEAPRIFEVRLVAASEVIAPTQAKTPRALAARAKTSAPVAVRNRFAAARLAHAPRTLRRSSLGKPALSRLVASGPIFNGIGRGLQAGVGREKIYVSGSALRLPGPWKAGVPVQGGEAASERSGAVDLKAGSEARAFPGSGLERLEGGIAGGPTLRGQGEAILQGYSSRVQAQAAAKRENVELPEASDAFFSITGPLSHRRILSLALPRYPRWAEESGVEARISLRLSVTADGKVKPEPWIEQSSGFPEFDAVAREAVLTIVFEPLSGDETPREEWGVATFNFRLKRTPQRGLL
ncbi:MAG TPA: hypothetical protein DEB40_09630 [Elusimicrobia bacterium]|nr:hypothetical protein [Elusimicrobiota bacterium]HBT61989.1 hypothetical protein [Elusimicrobiota bacterium]